MAELKVEVKVLDMPEVKAILAHYKKISRRHAWVNSQRTGKARKRGWKRTWHQPTELWSRIF